MAQVTSPTLLLACAVVFCLLAALLRQPLRCLPGPPASIFTSVALRWHEFRADRTGYIHRLHMRYGPVVRVGPREVSFSSGPAVKEIYGSGGSGYDKTEFYDLFRVLGRRTMFATLNKADVRNRRPFPEGITLTTWCSTLNEDDYCPRAMRIPISFAQRASEASRSGPGAWQRNAKAL